MTPPGEIVAFVGNPPYVEPKSERERAKRSRAAYVAEQRRFREREAAFRAAEKKLGVVEADLAGIDPETLIVKEGGSDDENARGCCVLEAPAGEHYAAYVSVSRQNGQVRVLMVGPREEKVKAVKTARVWLGLGE